MNPEDNSKQMVWVFVAVALVAGAVGGYFYGNSQGRSGLLSEQAAEIEAAKQSAQQEVAQKVNPFADNTDPLGDGYQNPFENTGSANPFRQ